MWAPSFWGSLNILVEDKDAKKVTVTDPRSLGKVLHFLPAFGHLVLRQQSFRHDRKGIGKSRHQGIIAILI